MKLAKESSSNSPILDLSMPHRILVLGDSITFIGHYLTYLEEFLKKYSPNSSVKFYEHGRSAETISGLCEATRPVQRPCLFERLEEVLLKHDDITDVIFCYGMNDGIYEPLSTKNFDAFKNGVNRLVQRVKELNVNIIAMTPPPFDEITYFKTKALEQLPADAPAYPIPYQEYDNVLEEYSKWLLLQENDEICHTINLHTPLKSFISKNRQLDSNYHYGDGIHPDKDGHYLMATIIAKDLFNLDMPFRDEV